MSKLVDLLPANATQLEKDLAQSFDRNLFEGLNHLAGDDSIPIKNLYNLDRVSSTLLPYLAYSLSVDYWDDEWSDAQKREIVRTAFQVHSIKGTIKSVKDIVAALGFTVVSVNENVGGHWARFSVTIGETISNSVAEILRNLINNTIPLRMELVSINYDSAQHSYNGSINYDGMFNYGST